MSDHGSVNPLLYLIPNVLSSLRLGLAIAFPFVDPDWWWIVIVFAGASDLADGIIARRFGLTSWIGGLLDATSDKAFTLIALGTFVVTDRLLLWQVVLLLARDLSVLVIAGYAVGVRRWDAFRRMQSRWPGKVTTALFFGLLVVVAMPPALTTVGWVLWWATAAASIVAGVDYMGQFVGALRDEVRERAVSEPPAG